MSDRKSLGTGTAVFGEYMLVLGMVFLTVFVSLINEDGAKLLDLALSCGKADGEYAGAVATAYSGRTGLKNMTVTWRTHENAELLTALKKSACAGSDKGRKTGKAHGKSASASDKSGKNRGVHPSSGKTGNSSGMSQKSAEPYVILILPDDYSDYVYSEDDYRYADMVTDCSDLGTGMSTDEPPAPGNDSFPLADTEMKGIGMRPEIITLKNIGAPDRVRLFALFMEKRLRRHGFPLLLTAVFTVCAMTDACIRRRINLLKGVTVTPLKNRIWKLIPLVFIIPATMVIIRLCRDTAGYELLLGLMGVLFAGAVREYIVNFPQVTGKMDG